MIVKICGVTHPDDAFHAALFKADLIGINFSPKSKRRVSLSLAIEIAASARAGGAEPVAVFVDETLEYIVACCEHTGIKTIQLYDKDLISELEPLYKIICSGTDLPNHVTLLVDSSHGTGSTLDRETFSPPNRPWMLAGGLTPANVAEAIRALQPCGVDVASGIEYPHTTRKDPRLVETFIAEAKR